VLEKIAITGSRGLIGSTLIRELPQRGYSVTPIVRSVPVEHDQNNFILWNIEKREIQSERLENHDVVIHLAGASIADKRWTESYKNEILASRINSTTFLCQTLAKMPKPPRLLICASAIGYYGLHKPEEIIDENSARGWDFLSEVCVEWEAATKLAAHAGIRVVNLRFGMVLSDQGGGLGKMLPIFKLGLGGVLSSGKQMVSWISLDEIPQIVEHLIQNKSISGPVNAVSPQPVSNKEFTKVLGHVLKRPTILPVPGTALRLAFGPMADTLLLGGAKVLPKKLLDSGYKFHYPDLNSALEKILFKVE
jgi:uncharacterized protein (TIGR01777 family)